MVCEYFLKMSFFFLKKKRSFRESHAISGRAIRHRACTLKDTTMALLNAELDPDFEKLCKDIAESRKKRGMKLWT